MPTPVQTPEAPDPTTDPRRLPPAPTLRDRTAEAPDERILPRETSTDDPGEGDLRAPEAPPPQTREARPLREPAPVVEAPAPAPRPQGAPPTPAPASASPLSPAVAPAPTLASAVALAVEDLAPETEAGAEAALSGPSTSSTVGPRTTATGVPLPARLASAAWIEALGTAAGRSVQVALGEDGTVRLRTDRDGDGVAVRLHFSDPELQALAGSHAARLREVLAEHFAEPVRLSLGDPSANGGPASDPSGGDARGSGERGGHSSPQPVRGPSGATASSSTDRPLAPDGRREWIG